MKNILYDKTRDEPKGARNVLLIVAALITAVTFQAGVNPPGGVWQDSDEEGHTAGRAIFAARKHAFYVFLVFNTLALSSSVFVIASLTFRFPFHFELWAATCSMIVTYASAVFAVTPNESVRFRYVLIAAAWPFVARLLIELFRGLEVGCRVLEFFGMVSSGFKSFVDFVKG